LFQTLPGMFFHSDRGQRVKTAFFLPKVSNPSRDVFPFWRYSRYHIFIDGEVEVSNPSRDVFPFWPVAQMRQSPERVCFKPFQGCFSILTILKLLRGLSSEQLVSNPSRDVFPFWPYEKQVSRWLHEKFQTLPGMFFHSDQNPWQLLRRPHRRFKPFQGCFSILTELY